MVTPHSKASSAIAKLIGMLALVGCLLIFGAAATIYGEEISSESTGIIKEDRIKVLLDSSEIFFDQPPVISEGRTLVPMRAIFEAMGAEVEWEATFQIITGTKGNTVVKMQIGNNVITKNGENIALDVPPQLINGRTLVPARAVAESFEAEVGWNSELQIVSIALPVVTLEVPETRKAPETLPEQLSTSRDSAASQAVASADSRREEAEHSSSGSPDDQPSATSREDASRVEASRNVSSIEIAFPETPYRVGDSGLILNYLAMAQVSQTTKDGVPVAQALISYTGEFSADAAPLDNVTLNWRLLSEKGNVVQEGKYKVVDNNGRSTLYPGQKDFYSWYDSSNELVVDLDPQKQGYSYTFEIVGYGGDSVPEPTTTFVLPKLPLTILYMDPIDYGYSKIVAGQIVHVPPTIPVEQQTREFRTTHRLTLTDIRVEQTYQYPDYFSNGNEGSVDIRIYASGSVDYVRSGRGYISDTLLFTFEVKNDPEKNPLYPSWYDEEPREGALRLTEAGKEAGRVSWQKRFNVVGYYVKDAVAGASFTDVLLSKSPRKLLSDRPALYIYPDDYVDPDTVIYNLLPGDIYYLSIVVDEETMEVE